MSEDKGKERSFRSLEDVKKAYLPELLKSQKGEVEGLIERSGELTERVLRKALRRAQRG